MTVSPTGPMLCESRDCFAQVITMNMASRTVSTTQSTLNKYCFIVQSIDGERPNISTQIVYFSISFH